MTVSQLIEQLKKLPQDARVYRDGGEYADDWRPVHSVSNLRSWGHVGVLIE
jgi:hypothetical protein